MSYFTFFSHYIFDIWHVFYIYSPSQFGVTTFGVLNSNTRLVAAELDSMGLDNGPRDCGLS